MVHGRRKALPLVVALLAAISSGCPDRSADSDRATEAAQTIKAPVSIEPAGSPSIEAASPVRIAGAKARLDRHLRRYALMSPDNTWALIHALLVFPPDTKLPDHDVTILDAVLSRATTVEIGGRVVPTFTGEAPDGTPREPHSNQVVKILLGVGVDLDHRFEVDGQSFTVNDLVDSALWRFDPPEDTHWEHESWTLSALGRSKTHLEARYFTNYRGRRFDSFELVQRVAEYLNREMEFIEQARRTGQPLQKRREGVHSHPCGGLHLARTPTDWMKSDVGRTVLMPAMRQAADTLAWRVTAEHEVYEQTRAEYPEHEIMISAQEMKFYGHWLETMHDLRLSGVDVDRQSVEHGISLLVDAVERLDRIGTFARMEDVRVRRVQTYRDLIGDAAHALRGLRVWTEE